MKIKKTANAKTKQITKILLKCYYIKTKQRKTKKQNHHINNKQNNCKQKNGKCNIKTK